MGRLIRRKDITSEQYKRANYTMLWILIASYLVFIGTEIINIGKTGLELSVYIEFAVFGVAMIASIICYKAISTTKKCMIVFAVLYLFSYGVLVFCNGVIVMVMVFPVLAGFMLYLNSVVVGLGAIGTVIICGIKCFNVMGDKELFNYAILIYVGIFVFIFGIYRAIFLLIDFGKEDQEVIVKEAEHRQEVAKVVASIVEKLNNDFNEIVNSLEVINKSMNSADLAMNEISSSTENTAKAVNHQAEMTTHIQERLENTNELTTDAKNVTEVLKNIIIEGKEIADELKEQSNIVDQNISRISKTVEQLVLNVAQVSGITESILNISEQTNLLALNASIEAARAGEAGRGFSVVAEEIRKLSEETKDSTEKITAIISELSSVTNETQTEIEESVNCINEQRIKVNKVNENFTTVEQGMFELEAGVMNMSSEVESVLEANTKIVDSIELLSVSSEEVSAGTETCKETIDVTFENLEEFSAKVTGAFEQLRMLKKTAEIE